MRSFSHKQTLEFHSIVHLLLNSGPDQKCVLVKKPTCIFFSSGLDLKAQAVFQNTSFYVSFVGFWTPLDAGLLVLVVQMWLKAKLVLSFPC